MIIMNQKLEKPLPDFTDKQVEAYKLAMKASAQRNLNRRHLYQLVKSKNIYTSDRDCREVVEMLLKNPNTPLDVKNSEVKNNLA